MGKLKILCVLLVLMPFLSIAQQKAITTVVAAAIDTFGSRYPGEKVFLHIDRPYYSTNDTIWMKAYILDAALNYSQKSGLLYTELIDDTGKVVIRQSMPAKL